MQRMVIRSLRPVLAAALLAAAPPVLAEDIDGSSKAVAVIVFPSGAEVKRAAKVAVPAGAHKIVFKDLPPDVRPETLRVEGQSTGELTIGSVDTRRQRLTSEEADSAAAERKRLEDELRGIKEQIDKLGYDIKARETQRDFLKNLAGLPNNPPPPASGQQASPDWAAVFSLLGTSMGEVQSALFDLSKQIGEKEREHQDILRRLERLAPKPRDVTIATVSVNAAAALEADLTLSYQVANAGWQSLYEARLTTARDKAPAKLNMIRRAAIRQNTSEPWTDVALSLSTVRPSARTSAPEIGPITVDFRPKPEARRLRSRAFSDEQQAERRLSGRAASSAPTAVARAPAGMKVRQVRAEITANAFQAVYEIAGTVTVPNTGEVKRVEIDRQEIEPELIVQTTPRLEPRAYLHAKLTVPGTTPFLAGNVALFRDNTFVGGTRLPQLAGGAEHELGFGADDQVEVDFKVVDTTKGESGIISSSSTDQRRYKISITNRHEQPVTYAIFDRIPVSKNEDIEIVRNGGTAPSRQNVDDKRGVIAWDGKLEPGKSREIAFGYRISWPSEQRITYR